MRITRTCVHLKRTAHNAGRPCRDTHNAGMGIHNADPPQPSRDTHHVGMGVHNADPPLPIKPESFSAHNEDTREPYNAGPTAMRISQRGQPYNAGLPTQSYISAEDTQASKTLHVPCAQPLQSTQLEFPRRLKYSIIKPPNRIHAHARLSIYLAKVFLKIFELLFKSAWAFSSNCQLAHSAAAPSM